MTDAEFIDWLEETRTTIQTNWHYERGHIVRLGTHRGPIEGNGRTLRDAIDCAMRIREMRMSERLR